MLNDDNDASFFVGDSARYDFHIDAGPLTCPSGSVAIGFPLRQGNNRRSYELLTDPAGDLPC